MIERFNSILYQICRACAWFGMLFLMGAMCITALDVALRQISSEGIYGAVDLVQLMIMNAVFLSIPFAFLIRGHVSVSILVDNFGRRSTALINVISAVLSTLVMLAIAWFGFEQASQQYEYGDISLTLGVPKIYYWFPLILGTCLSTLVCVHLFVESSYTLLTGRSGLTEEIHEELDHDT